MTTEERLLEFLLAMHMDEGKVCPEFETCRHPACRSNQVMWEMADAAIQGMTLKEYRQYQTTTLLKKQQLDAGLPIALTIKCFKCGNYGVVPAPAPGENVLCYCKAYDVVVVDTERGPDGSINNCSLGGGRDVSECQMCDGKRCPEAVRFLQPLTPVLP